MFWSKRGAAEREEEKQKRLLREVEELNSKYQEYIKCYIKAENTFMIFLGYGIDRQGNLCFKYIDKDTPDDCHKTMALYWWSFAHGKEFNPELYRIAFKRFKREMELIGLVIKNKEEK